MHQIGTLIINVKPENQYAISAKRKVCRSEHRKQQEIKEMTEPDATEESDTDKSIKKITKIKHVTDRNNHITKTVKIDGRKRIYYVHWITGYNNFTG